MKLDEFTIGVLGDADRKIRKRFGDSLLLGPWRPREEPRVDVRVSLRR